MLLKVSQVAERLVCSEATVYDLIKKKLLGHHRCPGVRVSEEQLAAYLEETKRERGNVSTTRRNPRPQLRHLTM